MNLPDAAQWLISVALTAALPYSYDEAARQGAVKNLRAALESGDQREIFKAFAGLSSFYDAPTCEELQVALKALTGKRGVIRTAPAYQRVNRRESLNDGLKSLGLR